MSDSIDKAIAKTAPPGTVTVKLTLKGGRSGVVVLPEDTTPAELLGLVAFLTGTVAPSMAKEQAADESPIVVPRPTLLVPH
jgi:hypothetical protein